MLILCQQLQQDSSSSPTVSLVVLAAAGLIAGEWQLQQG
jgi:hypothetical protein